MFVRYNRYHGQIGHNFYFENPISKVDRKTFRILMSKFCKHDIIYVFCNMRALYAQLINIMTKSGRLFFKKQRSKLFVRKVSKSTTVNFEVSGGAWEIENIFNMYGKLGYISFLYL